MRYNHSVQSKEANRDAPPELGSSAAVVDAHALRRSLAVSRAGAGAASLRLHDGDLLLPPPERAP
jgi:hypothetical protein